MKAALLLIDLQNDFLAARELQPAAKALVFAASRLLENCRAQKIPVFHIWTTVRRQPDQRMFHWKKTGRWQCVVNTDGHKTPALLSPRAGETIIHKSGFNGFANPTLAEALRKKNCGAVILAGLHLHACVRTAATESLERGWQVFVAEDAVASDDPMLAAATRRWLTARCVAFDFADVILKQVAGQKPRKLVHRSPRQTEKILFQVSPATADEIAHATRAAHRAWEKWRQTSFADRRHALEKFILGLEKAAPFLAKKMAMEIGKPVAHGFEEIHRAVKNIRDVLRRAEKFEFHKSELGGTVRHQPAGVVALISPWNNPVAIPVGKIAPALVYGNVVVWKPAPAAAKISEALLKIWRRCAGTPEVLQILPGDHITAQRLAADENIGAVTLTASASAGFAVQEICARRHVPLQGELSGNNAAIVWSDADLPGAAAQIVRGAFGFAGQRCTANRRVIVPEKLFELFWLELKRAAGKMVWGDPLKKTTDIGPLIHSQKRSEFQSWILAAQKSGARVESFFQSRAREKFIQAGAYAPPAMILCEDPTHWLVQEETMCPLLVVQRAKNFAHALKLCNGVRHGLVAALFSRSPALQKKFLAHARAGMLKINSSTAGADVSLPFGGWKTSGIGPPEHGESDVLFYTRTQVVYDDPQSGGRFA